MKPIAVAAFFMGLLAAGSVAAAVAVVALLRERSQPAISPATASPAIGSGGVVQSNAPRWGTATQAGFGG